MSWERLQSARARTLDFVSELDDRLLTAWPDPELSPICWHLGHVAFSEARFVLEPRGVTRWTEPHERSYAQGASPKWERAAGYDRASLFAYLRDVREAVLATPHDEYFDWFLACHEHQHRETIAQVLTLAGGTQPTSRPTPLHAASAGPVAPERVVYRRCDVYLGTDRALAYDNERPRIEARIEPFALASHPVSVRSYVDFIDDGGYARREHWSDEGWRWRERHRPVAPRCWKRMDGELLRGRCDGLAPLDPHEPVCGLTWYEADAFTRWAGGRLPTEVEWEHAAENACPRVLELASSGPVPLTPESTDMLGNVWEWTASWFEPRTGFQAHPYRGYSTPYFGGTHRVLRGGSFATSALIATATFRNWFEPYIHQAFAGVRVAYDV